MLIAALNMVDYAFLFNGDTLSTLISTLRPHLHVKVQGKWMIAPPFHEKLHTSAIIKRILTRTPIAEVRRVPHIHHSRDDH